MHEFYLNFNSEFKSFFNLNITISNIKDIPKKPKPHRLGHLIQFSELGGGFLLCVCVCCFYMVGVSFLCYGLLITFFYYMYTYVVTSIMEYIHKYHTVIFFICVYIHIYTLIKEGSHTRLCMFFGEKIDSLYLGFFFDLGLK